MKTLPILILLTMQLAASELRLEWSFNRTNNLFTFAYPAVSNRVYGLVRYDWVNDYYDQPYFHQATNTGRIAFDLDPKVTGGEDLNPAPSDNLYFYLVEQTL